MNGSLQNLALLPPDWPSVLAPSTFCHTTARGLFASGAAELQDRTPAPEPAIGPYRKAETEAELAPTRIDCGGECPSIAASRPRPTIHAPAVPWRPRASSSL